MAMGTLFLCPTPLGNLGDMTPRALDALRGANTVLAEDTRVTGKLLVAFDIKAHLERMDEKMLSRKVDQIVDRLVAGETMAFCSDAGMPGVSDPGSRLVAAARSAGVSVCVLPGATATVTAYVASGFSCPRFYFGGFFPRKATTATHLLESVASLDAVLLFYESPHRLVAALKRIASVYPHRRVAVCRELTKIHEEVQVGYSGEIADLFAHRAEKEPIKGEIVIVIDAPSADEAADRCKDAASSAAARVVELVMNEGHSCKDAATALQHEFGLSRNAAYEIAQQARSSGNFPKITSDDHE